MFLVIHHSDDGTTGYRRAHNLGEAVQAVEKLRNEEGVDDAQIYRLEEVPYEFRPYYRVELADFASPEAPSAWSEPEQPPDVVPELAEDIDPETEVTWADGSPAESQRDAVPAGNGAEAVAVPPHRRGLFGR